jgi:hypothetical protein
MQQPLTLSVTPWLDATVESLGFPARSDYVEWFWLPVLGPSATWLLRRIDVGFDEFPEGYMLDVLATARAIGVAGRNDVGTIFARALERLNTFGLAHGSTSALAVRRVLPPVSHRHLARMPEHLRSAHHEWLRQRTAGSQLDEGQNAA